MLTIVTFSMLACKDLAISSKQSAAEADDGVISSAQTKVLNKQSFSLYELTI